MRKKIVVVVLTMLLITPVMISYTDRNAKAHDVTLPTQIHGLAQNQNNNQDAVQMTCYFGGQGGMRRTSVLVSRNTAIRCYEVFHQLRENLTQHPFSDHTQQLKQEFITLLAQNHLIPANIPPNRYDTLLNPPWATRLLSHHINGKRVSSPVRSGIASAVLCDISGDGVGLMFPFIMLPRPRIVTAWMGNDGDVIVGKFLTIGGFHASGQQFGTALGFWGIGFAVAYPYGNVYGFAGYALFVTVTADQIESYPPNQAPVITGTDPYDNELNVPLTLSKLSFTINDPDGDLMSYTVTTSPDIGSGSGNLKPGGTYTVPVHGLQDLTQYSWTVTVSDTQHTTQQTFKFTTQAIAPIISDPNPADEEHRVPTDLQQLKFTLKDFQGDTMDYTVETSPFIGSGDGAGVHNGTYSVPVSNLQNLTTYHWFVNATDGTHWARKIFTFQTWFPTHFDPFEHGWQFRKQITIDHTSIPEDLSDFPVLVSIVDSDLKVKAQADGDDILFMDNTGVATLLNYEIEQFDGATGTLVAWVNIPQLSSQGDTLFYLYYGNPDTISLQNPTKTWNPKYLAVLHMNDATPSTVLDSTANGFDGAKVGPNEPMQQTGEIGQSQHFDGSNDYIQYANHVIPVGSKTISAWFKCQGTSDFEVVFSTGTGVSSNDAGTGWTVTNEKTKTNTLGCYIGNGGTPGHFMEAYITIPDTDWHFYTMTYDGTILKIYQDGTTATSTTTQSGSEAPPAYDLRMGRSNHPSYPYFLQGGLDEFRVTNTALSAGWITTEYANQHDPGSFFTIGPEVPGP